MSSCYLCFVYPRYLCKQLKFTSWLNWCQFDWATGWWRHILKKGYMPGKLCYCFSFSFLCCLSFCIKSFIVRKFTGNGFIAGSVEFEDVVFVCLFVFCSFVEELMLRKISSCWVFLPCVTLSSLRRLLSSPNSRRLAFALSWWQVSLLDWSADLSWQSRLSTSLFLDILACTSFDTVTTVFRCQ